MSVFCTCERIDLRFESENNKIINVRIYIFKENFLVVIDFY